ncbi:hypothetical protein PIB30_098681, partial [Stylosanthes scabra]|nr:hypothetical protein [Stylosanthes scabra]
MRRTPRICTHMCVGLAELQNVAASSTHKRGHPRLCVGLHNLGWASNSSTHMLASTHIRGSWSTWTLSLPSTHMLTVLRICVALDWASKDGVTFSSSN